MKIQLPYLLILFRLLCAPAILALAYFMGNNGREIIVALMYLG
jgi:hypothetical protein